jgi:hypothetical protein
MLGGVQTAAPYRAMVTVYAETTAMMNIIARAKSYLERTPRAEAIAASRDYRRGYMQGLRRNFCRNSSATGEEAERIAFADRPTLPDLERGYRDGFAGIAPQS